MNIPLKTGFNTFPIKFKKFKEFKEITKTERVSFTKKELKKQEN